MMNICRAVFIHTHLFFFYCCRVTQFIHLQRWFGQKKGRGNAHTHSHNTFKEIGKKRKRESERECVGRKKMRSKYVCVRNTKCVLLACHILSYVSDVVEWDCYCFSARSHLTEALRNEFFKCEISSFQYTLHHFYRLALSRFISCSTSIYIFHH